MYPQKLKLLFAVLCFQLQEYTNNFIYVLEQEKKVSKGSFCQGTTNADVHLFPKTKQYATEPRNTCIFISQAYHIQFLVSSHCRRWDLLVNSPIPAISTRCCACAACGSWPELCLLHSCGMRSCIMFPLSGWCPPAVTVQDCFNIPFHYSLSLLHLNKNIIITYWIKTTVFPQPQQHLPFSAAFRNPVKSLTIGKYCTVFSYLPCPAICCLT